MGPGQVHQVLVAVSLLALLAAFNGVNCAIQRDLQHTSAPMNANEVQQSLAEAASSYLMGDGDGSIVNLVAPAYQAATNKRARKMSAFMPMRGRKDGRDAMRDYESLDSGDNGLFKGLPSGYLGENDGDSSIMRLVAAGGEQGGMRFGASATPTPRQFANQFALRHLMTGGQRQSLTGADEQDVGYGETAGLMQAKLRRAFHPMRGKKSQTGAPAGLVGDTELAYPVDAQSDF